MVFLGFLSFGTHSHCWCTSLVQTPVSSSWSLAAARIQAQRHDNHPLHLLLYEVFVRGQSAHRSPHFSFHRGTFLATVNYRGQCSVFRDQEVIHSNVQLPMKGITHNAVAAMYMDGEPCIAIAGYGKGAGVYLRHALTLGEVRSLPYKEDVYCVCFNATGTKLFFGTQSG